MPGATRKSQQTRNIGSKSPLTASENAAQKRWSADLDYEQPDDPSAGGNSAEAGGREAADSVVDDSWRDDGSENLEPNAEAA